MCKRLTEEDVNNRLEKYGVRLLNPYKNQYDDTTWFICKCGNHYQAMPKIVFTGQKCRCLTCEKNHIKNELEKLNIELLCELIDSDLYGTTLQFRCFCGTIFHGMLQFVLTNRKSCGCLYRKELELLNPKGTKINKLTVISNLVYHNKKSELCYRCLCECGKQVDIMCCKILSKKCFACTLCARKYGVNQPRCNHPKRDTKRNQQRALFLQKVHETLSKYNLTLLSEYTRNKAFIQVRCSCGREYKTTYSDIVRGQRTTCSYCDYFIVKNVFDKYGTKILTSPEEYIGRKSKCEFQCFCGKFFCGYPFQHSNGFYKGSCGCALRIKSVDLAGTKFNCFTVLNNNFIRRNGTNFLECQCDCGKICLLPLSNIKAKTRTMCNLCSASYATKKFQDKNAREIKEYLQKNGHIQLSPYRGISGRIKIQCCCKKVIVLSGEALLNLARQDFLLSCRCNKIKNGKLTSNKVFQLHEILDKGIHNYVSKNAGCIDIACVYKGRKIAIEYDEWFWHKNIEAKDKNKTRQLLKNGWLVLRIRVSNILPSYRKLIKSIDKLLQSKTRFLAITHKSWRGYVKED